MDHLDYIEKTLPTVYTGIDASIQEGLRSEKISCERGCYHCCRIVALTALAEGVLLGRHVLQMPQAQRIAVTERLRESAVPEEMSNVDYARLGHHCGFLDMDTKDCVIYEKRPASCRYHFVVSPPELCACDTSHKIMILNLIDAERVVHEMSYSLTGVYLVAPLPNMVLHCMAALDRTKNKATKGVAGPVRWTQRYMGKHGAEVAEMKQALEMAQKWERGL